MTPDSRPTTQKVETQEMAYNAPKRLSPPTPKDSKDPKGP